MTMVHSVLREVAVEPGHSSTKLTYADYELFPDDGLRHEIIDGEHYVTASPITRHQRISLSLLHLIQSYLDIAPDQASCSAHRSTSCCRSPTSSFPI